MKYIWVFVLTSILLGCVPTGAAKHINESERLLHPNAEIQLGPDFDSDNLTSIEEAKHRTSVVENDTDSDSLSDYREIHSLNSFPTTNDSDGDNLTDDRELVLNTILIQSNTDEDEFTDAYEVKIGLPPTKDLSGDDFDLDGLSNKREKVLGTDKHQMDTDGDGFDDGDEIKSSTLRPGAHPKNTDIFVEIDVFTSLKSSPRYSSIKYATEEIKQVFNETVIGGDDVRIHFIVSYENDTSVATLYAESKGGRLNEIDEVKSSFGNYEKKGFYYAAIVSEAYYENDKSYAGFGYKYEFAAEYFQSSETKSHLILHELGHSMGIFEGDNPCVDAECNISEYPSVMNYNYLYEESLNFSNTSAGKGMNDWKFITSSNRKIPPTSNLPR